MPSRQFARILSLATIVPCCMFTSVCRADFTEEQGVSLEWLTDSSRAIAVVEPVEGERYRRGWPMRIARILKPDPRIAIGQIHRVPDPFNRPSPSERSIIFLRENDRGQLVIHEVCGRDLLAGYPGARGIALFGFDREGRFVQSVDAGVAIVAARVRRGPNKPEPDYTRAARYAGPFDGGFYRRAEEDFDDFYYMVLVPADPDFRPLVELASSLPIGYLHPGTLDRNYLDQRGPLSNRPLDSPDAKATLAGVLREMSPEITSGSVLVHSRRASRSLAPAEAATARQILVPSPDGRLFLMRAPNGHQNVSLLDAKTGETRFCGAIYRFSPTGRFFLTRHCDTAYGIRQTGSTELVCQLETVHLPHFIDPPNVRFTPDDRRVFFATHEGMASRLSVFDLDAPRQLVDRGIKGPYFRIQRVYSGSTFLLSRGINDPDLRLFNWQTGETEHHFDVACRLLQVAPDDRAVAYVKSASVGDKKTPDVFTLRVEELPGRRVLRAIELPCEPKELRFLSGGEVIMTIFELNALDRRRNLALLYGVNSSDVDGETVSWTPVGP